MDNKDYLPLSYLSQAKYCLRRAALLLNERVWFENAETAKGRAEHERVHSQRIEHRSKQIKLYEYEICSENLGLIGKCDCIEANYDLKGCRIPAADFSVSLYPIEYKHGNVRDEPEYKVQLCAEAMALEEMYDTVIPEAALFFISSHRRETVILDKDLRKETERIAHELHDLGERLYIPPAEYTRKCVKCSLNEYCMPKVRNSAREYCELLASEAEKVE